MTKLTRFLLITVVFGFTSFYAANAQEGEAEKRLDEVTTTEKSQKTSNWVEARSENFVYVAPVDAEKAEKTVRELEFYRAALFRFLGFEEAPETLVVKVYASPNTRELTRTVAGGIGGAYLASLDGPRFVLNLNDGSRSRRSPSRRAQRSAVEVDPDANVRKIIFHEYSHHITSTYSSRIYPTWYNEGFAEYLGSMELFEAKGDEPAKIHVGLPQQGRAFALERNNKWYDWEKLIATEVGYTSRFGDLKFGTLEAAQFYSQSWLAAHYIHSTPGLSAKMTEYINLLNSPEKPENAFEMAFEETPKDFGKKVKAYFKKNDYQALVTTFNQGFELPKVTTRALSEGEAAYKRAEMVSWFRADEAANSKVEDSLDRAIKAGGPRGDIYRAQALLASRRGKHDEAKAMITKALERDGKDYRTLQAAGMINMANYEDEDTPEDAKLVKEARDYFFDSMVANPDNLAAHYHYAASYAELGDKPDKQAVSSAIESALYYRSNQLIEENMKLADVLARGGEKDIAKYLYQKAATWMTDEDKRKEAEEALEKLK